MAVIEASLAAAPGLTAAFDGAFTGRDGATFTPSVTEDGVLSWTNDKGLDNPAPVNILGPQGEPGAQGLSPTLTVTDIEGGHRVTITDAEGEKSFEVMDGAAGGQSDLWAGDKARLRTTDDSRGNLQLYNGDGYVVVNAYAVDSGVGEVDVHDADGVVRAALYATTGGDGALKLANANGDAETLLYEDVQKLKGMGIKKLWENASPGSTFAAQTVSADWTGYDEVWIDFGYDGAQQFERISIPAAAGKTGYANASIAYESGFIILYRSATLVEGGVEISNAYQYQAGFAVVDYRMIPTAIYGFKGVLR